MGVLRFIGGLVQLLDLRVTAAFGILIRFFSQRDNLFTHDAAVTLDSFPRMRPFIFIVYCGL